MRINKYLALHLGLSRREADTLIEQKRVAINDTAAEFGARVDNEDTVYVNGEAIAANTDKQYIALHKPAGYVCSRRRQGNNPTVYDLLPEEYKSLKLVGRLDKDSSGIILLTNDGDFSHTMTHPSFVKRKIYKVRLDQDLEPLHQQMISDFGVMLEDGKSKLHLDRLSDTDRKEWQVTMTEGRNRQIRRTFSSLGYDVIKLHRTHFGDYALGDIKRGEYATVNIS